VQADRTAHDKEALQNSKDVAAITGGLHDTVIVVCA
jgi:hypothetical protein